MTAARISSQRTGREGDARYERMLLDRLRHEGRSAAVAGRRRGTGETTWWVTDLWRTRSRLGRFALAHALGVRADQLVEAHGTHWLPGGRGLLERALFDLVTGKAKVVTPPRAPQRSGRIRGAGREARPLPSTEQHGGDALC